MARFHRTVTLEAVPRRWFDECVAALHDAIEQRRPELDEHVTITAWDRRGETAAQIDMDEDETRMFVAGRLRPDRLQVTGAMEPRQHRRLGRFSWDGRAELDRWWTPRPGAAPIKARVRHMFGLARVELRQRPAAHGRWDVDVVVDLRGRWLAWPFVALGLAFAEGKVQKSVDDAITTFATRWNEDVPVLLQQDPGELVRSYFSRDTK